MLKRTELHPGVLETLKIMKYNQLKTCLVTDFTADVQIKKTRHLALTKDIV
jgi:FMN phosphatase YigB (HAD superfamily)